MTAPRRSADASHDPSPDFDSFFRAEYPRLVALGVAITSDREAARDVAQEALLRTFRDWAYVATLDRPGAWSRRVAVNLLTDRGRRRRTERIGLARLDRVASSPAPTTDRDFWAAVGKLPERQRTAIALYYVVDRSVDQIADAMDTSPGAVKSLLFDARRALARTLHLEEES